MSETKHQSRETDDPVLMMLGVGKQLWEEEPGNKFIERLRAEELPQPSRKGLPGTAAENVPGPGD